MLTPPSAEATRFVAVVGLHGSASTWAFNIAREQLVAAHGAAAVRGFSTERGAEVLNDVESLGRRVVWKVHAGDAAAALLFQLARPTMLVTIRDPRDALLSFSRRFEPALDRALGVLQRDCRRAMTAVASGGLLLRYEDGFVADPDAPGRIASHLGLAPPSAVNAALSARYATEAVRAFAGRLSDLPPERRLGDPQGSPYDSLTHIHANHIGQARVGAWREALPEPLAARAAVAFGDFLEQFGYGR